MDYYRGYAGGLDYSSHGSERVASWELGLTGFPDASTPRHTSDERVVRVPYDESRPRIKLCVH